VTEVNGAFGTVSDGGGTRSFSSPTSANDGTTATWADRGAFATGSTETSILRTDLGGSYTVTTVYLRAGTWTTDLHVPWTLEASMDGSSWTAVPVSSVHTDTPATSTLTLTTATDGRYWRITHTIPNAALHFEEALRVYSWEINGTPTTVPPPVDGPPYVAPSPGGALVEIYAAEPGAYRWGIAHWGESVWSTAGWQNVTPESVDVEILWGSQRPELGILSRPEAGSWAIDFYDPERTLDPANVESPYYGDLEPGLPVRVSHAGQVIRQGVAESIGYQFSREFGTESTALMRVTDAFSILANAMVPSDSTLDDTLFARARDAIAAAGLAVTVLPDPAGGDPALAPWETGQEMSAWEWIADAAESVLWTAYLTNVGHLGFRPWTTPLDRARVLGSPNLVGLQSIVQHDALYSIVQAQQTVADGDGLITRELTPKPRYGARTFTRDGRTPAASDWAFAVLNDRAQAGLRWVPGEVYPLTAADVTYFAEIEAVETVGLYYPEADPAVIQEVVVVGGRITVTAKKDSEAIWSFEYQAAQAAQTALVTEGGTDLLIRDDDPTEFLYPDG
jgi:hypothetical protein